MKLKVVKKVAISSKIAIICQQRVLENFLGPGYLLSEDGVA